MGSNWKEYLQFNFYVLTRIKRIYIGTPTSVSGSSVRQVTAVSLLTSSNCNFFTYVNDFPIPSNNTIYLYPAIETINLRIVVSKSDQTNSQTTPLAINRYFRGIVFFLFITAINSLN